MLEERKNGLVLAKWKAWARAARRPAGSEKLEARGVTGNKRGDVYLLLRSGTKYPYEVDLWNAHRLLNPSNTDERPIALVACATEMTTSPIKSLLRRFDR